MANRIVKVILRGEIGDLVGKMTVASKSVAGVADKMTGAGKESETFRRGLTAVGDAGRNAGLVAAGGLGLIARAAVGWESAWAGVTKTVDGSAAQMAALEDELRNMAKTLPATHEEIAAVAEAAGQLGVAREDITAFTRTMVDLGETTNLTADEAATSIAQMANVMRTAPEDIDNMGAALVALGNAGASTERDIIQMAQRISGAGAQVGLTEAEILALANAAASMGIEVEAGGSAISRVFSDMAKAAKQGGPQLATFARVAGVSATEFARAFEESPAQAFASFTAGLDRINKAGGDVFGTLDQLKLSDVRVSQALLGMAASGDLLTESLELGSKAWEENTALSEEAKKRYATSAAELQVAWNKIKDSAIEFGNAILPVLSSAAEVVGGIAEAFGDLPAPVKTATGALLGVTAVFGGSLWFGAKVIGGVSDLRKGLTNLGVTADGTSKKLLTMGNAARAGAGLGMLALSATDVDESMGAANTAMYALYGTMILPGWGTALGASIGAMQDLSAAAKESAEWVERFRVEFETAPDPTAQLEVVERMRDELEKRADELESGPVARIREALSFMGPKPGSSYTTLGQEKRALEEIEKQYGLNATAAGVLAGATAGVTGKTAAAIAKNQEAVAMGEEIRGAIREQAEAWGGLGDSVGDADTTLQEFMTSLEERATALDNFTKNLDWADKVKLPRGLIQEFIEMGEAGAHQLQNLRDATPEAVAAMVEDWRRLKREVDENDATVVDFQQRIDELNRKKLEKKRIEIEKAEAIRRINDVIHLLKDIPDGHATIKVGWSIAPPPKESFIPGVNLVPGTYATGGYTGDGAKYEPAGVVHRGEYVFSKEATQGNLGQLDRLHRSLRGYAAGGHVGGAVGGMGGIDYGRLAHELSKVRPLYGDVQWKGTFEDFKRMAQADREFAAIGGI